MFLLLLLCGHTHPPQGLEALGCLNGDERGTCQEFPALACHSCETWGEIPACHIKCLKPRRRSHCSSLGSCAHFALTFFFKKKKAAQALLFLQKHSDVGHERNACTRLRAFTRLDRFVCLACHGLPFTPGCTWQCIPSLATYQPTRSLLRLCMSDPNRRAQSVCTAATLEMPNRNHYRLGDAL